MTTEYSRLHRYCSSYSSLSGIIFSVPVVDDNGEIVFILSQSRLVKFLKDHVYKFDFATLTLNQTHLGVRYSIPSSLLLLTSSNVVSLGLNETVKKGLELMMKNKISAVALVDKVGKMVLAFSRNAIPHPTHHSHF